LQPLFLDGIAGRLFALYRPPVENVAHRGDVLFVPPFAEEMNRARRMATVTAERLARAGYGSLVFDLYGTGDSAGEFAEARLDIWRDDVRRALAWLAARGAPALGVIGLRLGALLALDAAATGPLPTQVVLWQPVQDGQQILTQFLRLRLAAAIGAGGSTRETPQTLRAQLAEGQTLEIAGYEISPGLAADLDAFRLAPLGPACKAPIHWLELVAEEGRPIPPGGVRTIEAWREAGVTNLDARTVQGDQFWVLLEISVAPKLVDATVEIFAGAPT